MWSTAYFVVVPLKSGSIALFEKVTGLDDGTGTVSCSSAIVARRIDIVCYLPFSSRTNMRSLTLTIGKGPNVLVVRFLYVVVAILAALVAEAVNGRLSTYTSCPGHSTGVFPTLLS